MRIKWHEKERVFISAHKRASTRDVRARRCCQMGANLTSERWLEKMSVGQKSECCPEEEALAERMATSKR
eukprot:4648108-Pyramimonas_sp.AAC.1